MKDDDRPSHTLAGFAAAATAFVSALDSNRRRIAEDAGVSGTELRALFHVAQLVSITPKELAAYLGMTTGAITAISRRLVDLGFFQRVDHPADRRSLHLELTPRGHDVMAGIHHDFNAMLTASTSSLDTDELEAFRAALLSVGAEVRERTNRP